MDTARGDGIYDDADRRARVRAHPRLNGIDYLEVDTGELNQRRLRVHLLAPDPPDDPALEAKVGNLLDALAAPAARGMLSITGGVRTTDVAITGVSRGPDHLVVDVNHPGDFSDYAFRVEHPDVDPFFSRVAFSFKAGCPARFDCHAGAAPTGAAEAGPHIDYLAKDYRSFRRALLDFLPTIIPQWTERREADEANTLLELFAYAGDQLSYYQDAVANEAYLDTARQRVSVRRHARLIDYAMHDGLSAMVLLHCQVAATGSPDVVLAADDAGVALRVLTEPRLPGALPAAIPPDRAAQALDAADAVFEVLLPPGPAFRLGPAQPPTLHRTHNVIALHDWGSSDAVLPRGATSADLAGDPGHLAPGMLLLLEETVAFSHGAATLPDARHRQVVRLTAVAAPAVDPVAAASYTRVHWDRADALGFDLRLSGHDATGAAHTAMAVARGNVLLAFHGTTATQDHQVPSDDGGNPLREDRINLAGHRFALAGAPLGYLPAADLATLPVAQLMRSGPAGALPALMQLTEHPVSGPDRRWDAVGGDLLGSGRFDAHVTVETGNDGGAGVRFGDGHHGMLPTASSRFRAVYRVGAGAAGNIGAESLTHFVATAGTAGIVAVTNPLPAFGGTDPEAVAAAKAHAPAAFHARALRAVTEQDHADAAAEHPAVRAAVARFRWTGSWRTVFVHIDPAGATRLDAQAEASVRAHIQARTLAGYDIELRQPVYVPLEVGIFICPEPGHLPADLQQAVLAALAGGPGTFFDPDNFGFGQPLHLSALLAAVESVPGVGSATATAFARRYDADPAATARNVDRGLVAAAPLEVLRLDNDPSFPENGLLEITVGGRT